MKKWIITLFILLLVCGGWGYLYILDFQKQLEFEQGRSKLPDVPASANVKISQTKVYVYPDPSDSNKTRIVYLAELKNSGNRHALITKSKIIYKRADGRVLKTNRKIETVPQWASKVGNTYVRDVITINEKISEQDIKMPELKVEYKMKLNQTFPYIEMNYKEIKGSKIEGTLTNKTDYLTINQPLLVIGLYDKDEKLLGILKTNLNNQSIQASGTISFLAEDKEGYLPEQVQSQISSISFRVQNGEVIEK